MDFSFDQLSGALDKLGKLPKPYRIALVPAVALVVLGGYVYFSYMPAKQQLAAIQGQQQNLQRKLREVQAVAENIESYEATLDELQNKLSVAVRQLPNSKELPVLLTDISSLGKNAGLDFKAFRPTPENHKDFYAEVPIEIEFTGTFHDVVRFFDEISRLPRIVNIGELNMQIDREDSVTTTLHVKGEARTFRFLETTQGTATTPGQG
ncbi:MAG: type 4a pilus biogenesis protein PilO [Myxococcales bacterium]|nr:type 4a pilus biogenesis protein PilO [Myxococcales bacterium]